MSFYFTEKAKRDIEGIADQYQSFIIEGVEKFLADDWKNVLYSNSDTIVQVKDSRLDQEKIYRLKLKEEQGQRDYRVFFQDRWNLAVVFMVVHRDEAYKDDMFSEINKRL